jgi:hypothetical protein
MFIVACFLLYVECVYAESVSLDETLDVLKKRLWSLRSGMNSVFPASEYMYLYGDTIDPIPPFLEFVAIFVYNQHGKE